MWIEAGFKTLKSGAFHWQRTRMTDPARAERLWLVLALATLGSLTLADFQFPRLPHYPRLSLVKRGIPLPACRRHPTRFASYSRFVLSPLCPLPHSLNSSLY
ncbi:MAG: hypothetical protein HND48_20350 [Chloroflexi bacterium]|nr:hypothetical protein [Chloroflexota bacterium]